jgi:glycolate oxidase iron-sulfur subunit
MLGQEMDSPRGRIYLLRAGVEGRAPLDSKVVEHFDTCLGCMACETACPSGVRYGPLLEETRALVARHHERSVAERWFRRLLFWTLPYAWCLRLLAVLLVFVRPFVRWPFVLKALPDKLRVLLSLAPDVPLSTTRLETPETTPAVGDVRLRVGLVTGCVQRAFFGDVNRATARVLSAEGCEVHAPRDQGCCGALALHAGHDETARAFARRLVRVFEDAAVEVVVVNAAGCGSALKEYGHLLRDDPNWAERARLFSAKVRDVTEVLAGFEPTRAPRASIDARVVYHDACHLAHAQRIRKEPRAVLASIPGLDVVEVAEPELCCGSAGIFNLVQPEMAAQLGDRKVGRIAAARPDVVVTSNPGCILQLRAAAARAGDTYRVMHVVELLEASVSGKSI